MGPLGELGALFNPGMRHEMEERRSKAMRREEEGNARKDRKRDMRIDLDSGTAVVDRRSTPGSSEDGNGEDPAKYHSADGTAKADGTAGADGTSKARGTAKADGTAGADGGSEPDGAVGGGAGAETVVTPLAQSSRPRPMSKNRRAAAR